MSVVLNFNAGINRSKFFSMGYKSLLLKRHMRTTEERVVCEGKTKPFLSCRPSVLHQHSLQSEASSQLGNPYWSKQLFWPASYWIENKELSCCVASFFFLLQLHFPVKQWNARKVIFRNALVAIPQMCINNTWWWGKEEQGNCMERIVLSKAVW